MPPPDSRRIRYELNRFGEKADQQRPAPLPTREPDSTPHIVHLAQTAQILDSVASNRNPLARCDGTQDSSRPIVHGQRGFGRRHDLGAIDQGIEERPVGRTIGQKIQDRFQTGSVWRETGSRGAAAGRRRDSESECLRSSDSRCRQSGPSSRRRQSSRAIALVTISTRLPQRSLAASTFSGRCPEMKFITSI